jgi:hypothetical protein
MSLGKPLPSTAPKMPEWVPIPGRPHWWVSTDGKGRWMYAPPLAPQASPNSNVSTPSGRVRTSVRVYERLRGNP